MRFKRHAYFLLDPKRQNKVLIHYVGDESVAVDFPHGTSKSGNHIYRRTCPSTLNQLVSFVSSCSSQLPSSHLPRNTRQVINLQQKERQKVRLSHDALYNVHELAYDLDGFVKVIKTFPDLTIVCSLDVMLKELDLVLQTQSTNTQLLSYDTTF